MAFKNLQNMSPCPTSLTILIGAIAILGTGCASMKIICDEELSKNPQTNPAIPFNLALEMAYQRPIKAIPDVMPELQYKIDNTHLFQKVIYPYRPSDQFDARLSIKIRTRKECDPNAGWKTLGILSSAFLLSTVLKFEDRITTNCTADMIIDNQIIKSYQANATATEINGIFSNKTTPNGATGASASINLMSSKLAHQLSQDRDFLLQEIMKRKNATSFTK